MRAEPAASKSKEPGFFVNFDVTIAVIVLLVIGFLITFFTIGPNEALRGFAAEAVILAVSFYIARQYLPWEDAPKERIKRPKTELIIALVSYGLLLLWAMINYGLVSVHLPEVAMQFLPLILLLVGPAVLLTWQYGAKAWGLSMPSVRELLVLAVIIAINIGLSQLFGRLLPPRELAGAQGQALGEAIVNGAVLAIVGVFVIAIVVEIFFRVFLQTRLAAFQQGRWALFTQAALYSLTIFPYLLSVGYPLPYAIAKTMVLSNGIMAGYFWRKTGSLPLLVLLHVFAFWRIGL
jgi:membrane protease YdiL (CAAX protease family)